MVTDMAGVPCTVVDTVALLLPVEGSATVVSVVASCTVAVLLIFPAAPGAFTLMVICTLLPAGRLCTAPVITYPAASLPVTLVPSAPQIAPPVGLPQLTFPAVTPVMPTGMVSLKVAPVAGYAPVLVMVSV